jgi:mannose-6-phosphate isomerase-like protein (cupin superfamily)
MKKVLGCLLVACVAAGTMHLVFAADHKQARVTEKENDVRLLAPNMGAHPANVNDPVPAGTAVKTGGDSRAELTFVDQTIARLGSNTVFNVSTDPHTYDLGNGAILMYAPKQAGTVKINTSVATAAVTGFTIMFEYHKNSWSKFIVLEGDGSFALKGSSFQPCHIQTGQMIVIPPHPTLCPEPHFVDLNGVLKTAKLITKFQKLPSLTLIQQAAGKQANSPPPPGGYVDPTSIDTIDQGTHAMPTPPPMASRPPPG